MFCAISGDAPKEPVVSKSSGLLFEKRLIEKAIKETGKCPVTGNDLSEEDLLPVHAAKVMPPRSSGPSSVPGLLYTLQQEWDETVLETFSLRQQLDVTRKELALALYQHDAACRVIARLMKEKEEALNLLKEFKLSAQQNGHLAAETVQNTPQSVPEQSSENNSMEVSSTPSAATVEIAEIGVTESVIAELNATCKALSSTRKQRKPSEKVLSKNDMVNIQEKAVYASPSASGVTSLAVKNDFVVDNASQAVILTGQEDHTAVLSSLSDGKVYCQLSGHTGRVNKVAFAPTNSSSALFTASDDHTVRLWTPTSPANTHFQEDYQYTKHTTPVVGLTIHPTGHYFVSVGQDQDWHFVDVVRKAPLKIVHDSTGTAFQYSACAFHPDGLILGTGTNQGVFKIWDVREQKNVANLQEHVGAIQSVAFSENGYLAASGSTDGFVKIWDLRKLVCTKSFEVGSGPVNAVAFDYSGLYLGIGGGGENGQQVHVKVVKDWSPSALLSNAHGQQVTGLAWGEHATALVTSSLDRTVKIFGSA